MGRPIDWFRSPSELSIVDDFIAVENRRYNTEFQVYWHIRQENTRAFEAALDRCQRPADTDAARAFASARNLRCELVESDAWEYHRERLDQLQARRAVVERATTAVNNGELHRR